METTDVIATGATPGERIRLHLLCPWRTITEARFHLAGIMRELEENNFQLACERHPGALTPKSHRDEIIA